MLCGMIKFLGIKRPFALNGCIKLDQVAVAFLPAVGLKD